MLFGKKSKDQIKCRVCSSKVSSDFAFCPHCGSVLNEEPKEDDKDYGLLGKDDSLSSLEKSFQGNNFGITDKIVSSIFNSLVKSLDKQFKDVDKQSARDMGRAEIKSFPTGIRIKISPATQSKPKQKAQKTKRVITPEQMEKMTSLPRSEAKANVRRLSDKVIYELTTPGVESTDDVFVSKLENGYEIKAIGNKKVYFKSLPVNLPIRGFSIGKNKLLVEFKTENE